MLQGSLCELLTSTMSESLILFDQGFYKQHDGVAIGSPLEPKLVFLCYHEKIWLQNCSSEFQPVIYRRYVDDTFLLFHSKYHIEKFRNRLNCQHENILFTPVTENKNSISFLYIKISRVSNKLTTSFSVNRPCLRYYTGHSNFTQILNFFMSKLTS